MYVDRHRMEHIFEIGDVVYLTVQPFRPSPWTRGGAKRMRPRLFGPFKVIQRVGEVAYKLELITVVRVVVFTMYHASRGRGDLRSLLPLSYLQ
jgi:hypothetical protein